MFIFVVDRYKEKHKKWHYANSHSGGQRFGPEHEVSARNFRLDMIVMVMVVMVVMMVMVVVARTQFRESQEHKHEQQHPDNVADEFLERRHYVEYLHDSNVPTTYRRDASRQQKSVSSMGLLKGPTVNDVDTVEHYRAADRIVVAEKTLRVRRA